MSSTEQKSGVELIKSGYAGIMPNGNIVDRRENPTAMPMKENPSLGIPKPALIGLVDKPAPTKEEMEQRLFNSIMPTTTPPQEHPLLHGEVEAKADDDILFSIIHEEVMKVRVKIQMTKITSDEVDAMLYPLPDKILAQYQASKASVSEGRGLSSLSVQGFLEEMLQEYQKQSVNGFDTMKDLNTNNDKQRSIRDVLWMIRNEQPTNPLPTPPIK